METIKSFFSRLRGKEEKRLKMIYDENELNKPKRKWKYFTEDEVYGLIDDLIYKLDRAREYYGNPIIITSGYRDPEKNDLIGGVKDSAHIKGMAVDIKAPSDPFIREKLAWALGLSGFQRVLSYEKHFHADVDKEKPYPLFIEGNYK